MAICCSCVCTWVIVASVGYFLYKKFSGNKDTMALKKRDWKKDTVYLFQYARPPKMANYSPFCLKVEMFLRINNIPYENVFASKERSKHGLLPFIELNGVQTADSQLILELLKEHFKVKSLSAQDESYARAIERMADIHTFSVLIHYKFQDGTGFLNNLLELLNIPFASLLQPILKPFIKKRIAARINGVVGGALSEEEFHLLLKKDLDSLAGALGDKNFLFGDELHAVDCSVFAQLATLCFLPGRNEVKRIVAAEYPTLQKYQERIIQQVFPKEFA